MLPEVFRSVAGCDRSPEPARLEGYARYRLRGVAYPGLVPAPGVSTDGVLYRGIGNQLARLDRFEGEAYERVSLAVHVSGLENLETEAEVYVLQPNHHHLIVEEAWELAAHRAALLRMFATGE